MVHETDIASTYDDGDWFQRKKSRRPGSSSAAGLSR
jgi:hypothetical protein